MTSIRKKSISAFTLTAFLMSFITIPSARASELGAPVLPQPGMRVELSPEFVPAHLRGITIHPENALQFDFLINKGDEDLSDQDKKQEYNKLIKYFLASLTIPDEDQWVNLSPYEKGRIIENNFGQTEMGRDLLSQDYLLKQITSSLMYPEGGMGKVFWDRVYKRAYEEFGTTNIPMNTFNKVWIVPDDALIYEKDDTAFVLKSHFKVMMEEDYVSMQHNALKKFATQMPEQNKKASSVTSRIIKEILLPEIEKEVNTGKNFAMLRQIYSGMILATWYKKALKESLLGKVYANKAKVSGVDQDPINNEKIYEQYLAAFRKGVFNYIKDEQDPYAHQIIPRKYFSGGFLRRSDEAMVVKSLANVQSGIIKNAIKGGIERVMGRFNEKSTFFAGPSIAEWIIKYVDNKPNIVPVFTENGFSNLPYEQVIAGLEQGKFSARVERRFNARNGIAVVALPAEEANKKVGAIAGLTPSFSLSKKADLSMFGTESPIENANQSNVISIFSTGRPAIDRLKQLFKELPNQASVYRLAYEGREKYTERMMHFDNILEQLYYGRFSMREDGDKIYIYESDMFFANMNADNLKDMPASLTVNSDAAALAAMNDYVSPFVVAASERFIDANKLKEYMDKQTVINTSFDRLVKLADAIIEGHYENSLLEVSGSLSDAQRNQVRNKLKDQGSIPLSKALDILKKIGDEKGRDTRSAYEKVLILLTTFGDEAMFGKRAVPQIGEDVLSKRLNPNSLNRKFFPTLRRIAPEQEDEYLKALNDVAEGRVELLGVKGPLGRIKMGQVWGDLMWKFKDGIPLIKANEVFKEAAAKRIDVGPYVKIIEAMVKESDKAMYANEGEPYFDNHDLNIAIGLERFEKTADDAAFIRSIIKEVLSKIRPEAYGLTEEVVRKGQLASARNIKRDPKSPSLLKDTTLSTLINAAVKEKLLAQISSDQYDAISQDIETKSNGGREVLKGLFMRMNGISIDAAKKSAKFSLLKKYYTFFNTQYVLENGRKYIPSISLVEDMVEELFPSQNPELPGGILPKTADEKKDLSLSEKANKRRKEEKDSLRRMLVLVGVYRAKPINLDEALKIDLKPTEKTDSDVGGIDLNSANLNLQIKRDGNGVPLPLPQQDMNQLMNISGFVPNIIEIKPAANLPILTELKNTLQQTPSVASTT